MFHRYQRLRVKEHSFLSMHHRIQQQRNRAGRSEMKVFLCYDVSYDYCNTYKNVAKVVADEDNAISWCDEIKHTECEWREYSEEDVEI